MLLYIIRHGDPDYATDTLTEKGRAQAEAVGNRLFKAGIDRVFSSPLGRARQTAEPLCRISGLECSFEEWAREIDPIYTMTNIAGTPQSVTTLPNIYYRTGENADLSYSEAFLSLGIRDTEMKNICSSIEKNGDEFLCRLGYQREGDLYRILRPNDYRVALFCHGAMGRTWIASLLKIPLHIMYSSFAYTHTGVTVLEFRNNPSGLTAPKCLVYSDMSHIYGEMGSENMKYNNKAKI